VAAASVDGVVDALNAVFGLPADATEAPAEVAAMIESVSAPDSEARTFLDDQLALALDPAIALRGGALGQAMGPAELADDGSFMVDGCLSLLTENATDDVPSEGIATSSGLYAIYPLEGELTDGSIQLTQISDLDATNPPAECVPPDVDAEVTAAWEQYIEAIEVYVRDTSDDDARADVARWSQPDSVVLNRFDDRFFLEDTQVDLVVDQASRGEVELSWCQDPGANPDSRVERADGSTESLTPLGFRATWALDEGTWKNQSQASFQEPDDRELWSRCFG